MSADPTPQRRLGLDGLGAPALLAVAACRGARSTGIAGAQPVVLEDETQLRPVDDEHRGRHVVGHRWPPRGAVL